MDILVAAHGILMFIGIFVLRLAIGVIGIILLAIPPLAVVGLMAFSSRIADAARGLARAGSLKWRRDAYYAPWHTWVAPVESGKAVLGVDAFIGRLLPRVLSIQVEKPGTRVAAGDVVARVTSADRAVELRAPSDGVMLDVNEQLARRPDLIRRRPYDKGWLALFAPEAEGLKQLSFGDTVRNWFAAEDHRLNLALQTALGTAAADGGDYVKAPITLLDPDRWSKLVEPFVSASPEKRA